MSRGTVGKRKGNKRNCTTGKRKTNKNKEAKGGAGREKRQSRQRIRGIIK